MTPADKGTENTPDRPVRVRFRNRGGRMPPGVSGAFKLASVVTATKVSAMLPEGFRCCRRGYQKNRGLEGLRRDSTKHFMTSHRQHSEKVSQPRKPLPDWYHAIPLRQLQEAFLRGFHTNSETVSPDHNDTGIVTTDLQRGALNRPASRRSDV